MGPVAITNLAPGAVTQPAVTQQLARVQYKRPDSWHWLFAAKLLDAPAAPAGEFVYVKVVFDLTIGIGRAQQTLQNFETFEWLWFDGVQPPYSEQRYSTQAISPPRLVDTTTPPFAPLESSRLPITQIVAQDIQLGATVSATRSLGAGTALVEASAFFSPRTHVRPEWHLHHFFGGES